MDPIYSKLATTAIEQTAKKTESDVSKPLSGGESPFKQMLDQMDVTNVGKDVMGSLGMSNDMTLSGAKMEAIPAGNISMDPTAMNVGLDQPEGTQKVVDFLADVNKSHMQMDNLITEILYSGKKFSHQELLAIQAYVFQFAQMTEITAKVAEQGVSSVKTVLNTQVQ